MGLHNQRMKRLFIFFVSIMALLRSCPAQQPKGGLSFDVASIRSGASADAEMIPIRMNAERSRIHYVNVSLRDCIRVAFGVKDFQISGPVWMGERFNIDATYPAGATEKQVPEMLQSLLRDRFRLELHREMKEHAVLALVIEKRGPKLKETQAKEADFPDGAMRRPGTPVFGAIQIMGSPSGMHLTGPGVTMRALSETLSIFTDKPVVDQTGLQGRYDIDLIFAQENTRFAPRGPDGPRPGGDGGADIQAEPRASLFAALQECGLRLESRKVPLLTLVLDHLEKMPTDN
jgi:uncharacterized protein (TIGR03435 family)